MATQVKQRLFSGTKSDDVELGDDGMAVDDAPMDGSTSSSGCASVGATFGRAAAPAGRRFRSKAASGAMASHDDSPY